MFFISLGGLNFPHVLPTLPLRSPGLPTTDLRAWAASRPGRVDRSRLPVTPWAVQVARPGCTRPPRPGTHNPSPALLLTYCVRPHKELSLNASQFLISQKKDKRVCSPWSTLHLTWGFLFVPHSLCLWRCQRRSARTFRGCWQQGQGFSSHPLAGRPGYDTTLWLCLAVWDLLPSLGLQASCPPSPLPMEVTLFPDSPGCRGGTTLHVHVSLPEQPQAEGEGIHSSNTPSKSRLEEALPTVLLFSVCDPPSPPPLSVHLHPATKYSFWTWNVFGVWVFPPFFLSSSF